jgi:hypothetical protein
VVVVVAANALHTRRNQETVVPTKLTGTKQAREKERNINIAPCLLFPYSCYYYYYLLGRFYGVVARVPVYGSRGQGSIPGATRFSEE